jgi:hypothetical protein
VERWQRYAVQLKGEAEPVIVQTSARDFATVKIDPDAGLEAVGIMFQTVQHALRRAGIDVPADYGEFLDVLDAMPEVLTDADPHALDPTNAAPSGSPP